MIELPVFVIPMPLNANGDGPAEKEETIITVYQIWDITNRVIGECSVEANAKKIAELINKDGGVRS